ncbi:conserved hypothetical protein [Planktothrix serta PCC 8927]|uniref:Uncharacterized protein n=1 Tax=Planktothrix serta PCC 8927 TaxID=671068 RepID=A0A7Z9C404_9CYAN|nr:hypothetical protein [Planktothrix serta]VXD25023.1 conserved hypothetical protein [Planktothrix serta PCC 8927]
MDISDRTSFIKSSTLQTLITELGEECQTVIQLLDKIQTRNSLSDSEKLDSLAELLAAIIHLQTHCGEDLQTLIAEELEQLPDSDLLE